MFEAPLAAYKGLLVSYPRSSSLLAYSAGSQTSAHAQHQQNPQDKEAVSQLISLRFFSLHLYPWGSALQGLSPQHSVPRSHPGQGLN